jgi:hypothetical protein
MSGKILSPVRSKVNKLALECDDCGPRAALRRLAASANVSHLAVDVLVFLIKGLLRYKSRCRNIGGARLAVTYRGWPWFRCGFDPRGEYRSCDQR